MISTRQTIGRLGGWQRIGIVVSILWLVGGFWGLRFQQYREGEQAAEAALDVCAVPPKTVEICWLETEDFRKTATAVYWLPIIVFTLLPIPIFWIAGWATIKTARWVMAGFSASGT